MQKTDSNAVCRSLCWPQVCQWCGSQTALAESSQVAAEDRRDEAETRAQLLSERWQDAESAAAAARLETVAYNVALQSLNENYKQVRSMLHASIHAACIDSACMHQCMLHVLIRVACIDSSCVHHHILGQLHMRRTPKTPCLNRWKATCCCRSRNLRAASGRRPCAFEQYCIHPFSSSAREATDAVPPSIAQAATVSDMVQVQQDAGQTKQRFQDACQQLHIVVGVAALSQFRIAHLEAAVLSSQAAFESAEAEQQRRLQKFDRKLALARNDAAAVQSQFADRETALRAAFESAEDDWRRQLQGADRQLQEADRQVHAANREIASFEAHMGEMEEASRKDFKSAQDEWQRQVGDAQAGVEALHSEAAEAQQRLSRATETMAGLQRYPLLLRGPLMPFESVVSIVTRAC